MRTYEVRERIGEDFHVYQEFKSLDEAQKYMGRLASPSNFDIKAVDKK